MKLTISKDFGPTLKYCRKCKKNCPLNQFTSDGENSPYTTCNDCRLLRHNQSYPPVFPSRPSAINTLNSLSMLDLYTMVKILIFFQVKYLIFMTQVIMKIIIQAMTIANKELFRLWGRKHWQMMSLS